MIEKNPWGWIIIDKASHMTSMSVTRRIKRLTQSKKVGHAGTLDPLATGILPVAINQATCLIPELMAFEKQYVFTVSWGASTDTDDCLGNVSQKSSARPRAQDIEKVLPAFTGAISQVPPHFCAAKIKGVPAYRSARKGEKVHLSPRTISISNLTLLDHTEDSATFQVVCGTGTYVRSLARDIAHQLGTLGHITKLHRSWVGPFHHGITIDDLLDRSSCLSHLMPPEQVLFKRPHCVLSSESVQDLWHGKTINAPMQTPPLTKGGVVCYDTENTLVAMGFLDKEKINPVRCFIR